MSSPPSDRDLLSRSPSLLEILAFVSFEDIFNCKLVNRRFYGTILSNSHNLPRHIAYIDFNTKLNEDESKVEYIYMYIHISHANPYTGMAPTNKTSTATKVLITNHRLRIMHSRKEHSELIKCYIYKGAQLSTTTGFPDDDILEHIDNDQSFHCADRRNDVGDPAEYHSLDFGMTNMEETLGELFHLLASHYHLHLCFDDQRRVKFNYNTPEGLLKIMGDAIHDFNGRCEGVKVHKEHEGLEEFCGKTNCVSISATLTDNLPGFLASISRRKCSAWITVERYNYLPNMVDFIQNWESSSLRVSFLLMNGSPEWSNHELVSTLTERLQNISVKHIQNYAKCPLPGLEDTFLDAVTILVERTTDDAVLEVSYSRDYSQFWMRDYTDDKKKT